MKRRKFGWHPDPRDERDYDEDMLGLASTDLPESVMLEQRAWYPRVYDQRSTNSCVGQAVAGLYHIGEQAAYGQPAALVPYYHARKYSSPRLPVLDRGTYLRDAIKMSSKLGCCNDVHWPFSTSRLRVNRRPSFKAHVEGHARTGGMYFSIREHGDDRVLAIKAALTSGFPIAFGTRVTEAFASDAMGEHAIYDTPRVPDEPIAGGHAMVIVGYQDGMFRVRNSWGIDWGDDGHCWFTEEYMRWAHTRSFWVFEGWPLHQQIRSHVDA